jgi:hypothetical protein
MIQMITEEKEALVAYKSLCAKFQITPDPTPEKIVKAKVELLEMMIKDIPTSKRLTGRFGS